jgi:ADP-heptose:LPS heptosyltransferase
MVLTLLDLASRALWLRVRATLGAAPTAPLPDWTDRPYRVLFLRDDRVGDMVASLKVMQAIAESSQTIMLDVLASPGNADLARGKPWIAELLIHDRQSLRRTALLYRELGRRRYDAVIDARVFVGGVSLRTTLTMLASRARWRIGLAGRRGGAIYTVPVNAGDLPHWIDYLVALASPFGVAPSSRDWRPELEIQPDSRAAAEPRWNAIRGERPRVLVNISAGNEDRRWPDESWRALLERLRERAPNARIAVLAMPADRASAQALAAAPDAAALTLSLPDTIATVATADLVVTPDTAISHIASAFNRPTLTLLRRGFDKLVPYRTPGRNVFGDDPRRLDSLPATRVLAALEDVLADLPIGRDVTPS